MEIVQNIEVKPYTMDELRVYMATRQAMDETGYSHLLDAREYDPHLDPFNILRLDQSYIPAAKEFDHIAFDHIAHLLDTLVIEHESRIYIIEQFKILLEEIMPLLKRGCNFAIALNHMSYADLLLLQHCLAAAEIGRAEAPQINKHHVIVRRSVGLFKMNGLKADGSAGYMIDDALRKLGGVFLTLPLDEGGEKISEEIRNRTAKQLLDKYTEVLKTGGNITFIIPNGKEDIMDGHMVTVPKINNGAGAFFALPNRERAIRELRREPVSGKECFEVVEVIPPQTTITIPAFLNWQPLDEHRMPRGPVSATINFSKEPFIETRAKTVEQKLASQIIALGNEVMEKSGVTVIYGDKDT